MKKTKKQKIKLNNSGVALVTVVVVIAFISVMATVILYASGMNYFMKATDMNIKESFYDGETALEEIKAALIADAGEAYKAAYRNTMVNFADLATGTAREESYKKQFVKAFKEKWEDRITAMGTSATNLDYLKTLVEGKYAGGLSLSVADNLVLDVSHEADGYVVIKGVKLSYVVDNYNTEIETDFMIKAPELDWQVESSAIVWEPGDGAEALNRDKVDVVKSVNYYNWTKK